MKGIRKRRVRGERRGKKGRLRRREKERTGKS